MTREVTMIGIEKFATEKNYSKHHENITKPSRNLMKTIYGSLFDFFSFYQIWRPLSPQFKIFRYQLCTNFIKRCNFHIFSKFSISSKIVVKFWTSPCRNETQVLVVYLFLRDKSFNVCFSKVFLLQLERESKKVRKKVEERYLCNKYDDWR